MLLRDEMADQHILEILRGGVDAWNEWNIHIPDNDHIDLTDADLSDLNLAGIRFQGVDLSGVDFNGSDLSSAYFHKSHLRGSILTGANLEQSRFCLVSLSNAVLRETKLIDVLFSEVGFPGVDLSGADLSRTKMTYVSFQNANLSHAMLRATNISDSNFLNANLTGADLTSAIINHSNFSGVNLSKANIRFVNFRDIFLHMADLSESQLDSTIFLDSDLTNASGLDACVHLGPSYLEMQTLQRSGQLPHTFLQGCGLSDQQIDNLNTLYTQPIQYYSCFISHSTEDKEFINVLCADLRREGINCWCAPKDIQGGKKIYEQIDQAIRRYDKLLLVLSRESMNSEWVKTEVFKSFEHEMHEGKRVLFPIRLVGIEELKVWELFDSDIGKDLAKEIREYYIPDFSNWESHENYQTELKCLIRDLKQEHTLNGD
jgi:uncharacterized protein YjbI with pentapeptide repeats